MLAEAGHGVWLQTPPGSTCHPTALARGRLCSTSGGGGPGALRKPNAEGCQASRGHPAQSGCSQAALAPQHVSFFLQLSPKREMMRSLGVGVHLVFQPSLSLCRSPPGRQELRPGGGWPWLPCRAGLGSEQVLQKRFVTFRAEAVAQKLPVGLWGSACSCPSVSSHMLFPGPDGVPAGIVLVTVVWLLGVLATACLQSMTKCVCLCVRVLVYLKIFE